MKDEKNQIPLVTVIMPAYNAEKYIKQAIESVLAQNVAKELIIIDDCSTDNTANEILDYTKSDFVKYIKNNKNMGVAESRNVGMRLARGKYIAFLDSDDWWERGKLEEQVALLEEKQGVLCCTGRELVNPDGRTIGRCIGVPESITFNMMLKTNYIPCSSVVMLTSVAREFYMSHDELHEDYILWLQVLKKYKLVYGINKPMLVSRLSEGGKSRNKIKSSKMHFGVYRHLGFGYIKSIFYFVCYAFNGVKKYYFKK